MAVKYVKDFSFPSDFGFHKNGSSTVVGKAKGGHIKPSTPQPFKAGGKPTTPQAYRKGGEVQGPQSKYAGHAKKHDDKGSHPAGASKLSYGKLPHHEKATRTEKGSGMQSPAFKHGGKMHKKDGGKIAVAHGKVKDGEKTPWNKDDGVSPGSPKRTPPGQGMKNSSAAKSKFATDGENTEPATPQTGNVDRMSEFSDFKHGGKVKHKHKKGGIIQADRYETGMSGKKSAAPDKKVKGDGEKFARGGSAGHREGCKCSMCGGGRIDNLKHYAHGGKVYTDGSTQKPGGNDKAEKHAGTPKKSHDGSKGEVSSGKAEGKSTEKAQGTKRKDTHEKKVQATRKEYRGDMGEHNSPNNAKDSVPMAGGGLSRGTSPKQRAAIHAKSKHASPSLAGPLAAAAAEMGGMGVPHAPPGPGMGPTPPGMAPGMGAPPGGAMGGMRPQGPPMGQPAMSHGGKVTHVVHHVIRH
jgi:hypothetical protein